MVVGVIIAPPQTHNTITRGPQSIGIDVSFLGAAAVYGIPEHATSFALKNTDGTNGTRTQIRVCKESRSLILTHRMQEDKQWLHDTGKMHAMRVKRYACACACAEDMVVRLALGVLNACLRVFVINGMLHVCIRHTTEEMHAAQEKHERVRCEERKRERAREKKRAGECKGGVCVGGREEVESEQRERAT